MPREIRKKSSFGTVALDHFSPPVRAGEHMPKALNVVISFEEALKLQMGLLQILGKLNGYDRGTKEGRRTAVNLCLFLDPPQITINEDKIR